MTFKQRVTNGEMLYGAWSGFADTNVIQILGRAGFDFVCVDLQHSFNTMAALGDMLDALDKTDAVPVVRVPWNVPDQIMRALDLGAQAVIVPLINNAEEAALAANACRYAPAGNRSWGPIWRNVRASVPQPTEGDDIATCLVMIETADGLANLDAILAVDGVHGIYIGPNDLSLSIGLGRTSYLDSEKLRDTILHIISRAKAAGKMVGIDCGGPEQAHYWREQGVNFVISANDSDLLTHAANTMAKANRA